MEAAENDADEPSSGASAIEAAAWSAPALVRLCCCGRRRRTYDSASPASGGGLGAADTANACRTCLHSARVDPLGGVLTLRTCVRSVRSRSRTRTPAE